MTTAVPKPKNLVNIYCSHRLFLFANPLSRPTFLPFLTHAKAPQRPPTGPSILSHQLLELLHPVEGRASLEPLDLRLVEGVVERDGVLAAVAVLDHCCQGLGEDTGGEKDHVSIIYPVFHRHNVKRS